MSNFRVLALGVGDAFSQNFYSSCLALEADGAWLLIDCPHPIRKILKEASAQANVTLDVEHLIATVITHLHGDHSSGLEGLGYYTRYSLQQRMTLLAHPEVASRLWDGHLAAGMEFSVLEVGAAPTLRTLEEFFHLLLLREEQVIEVGPFSVECRKTIHSVPTTALRIRAGGRCLGYSCDTAFDPHLLEWLSESDLIIHETGEHGLHTPYENLAHLPRELRKKIRLIHYADSFPVENSVIEPIHQGQLYEI